MTDPWSRYEDRGRLPDGSLRRGLADAAEGKVQPLDWVTKPARRIDWRQVRRDLGALTVAAILGIAGLIVLSFGVAVATGVWSPW